MIRTFIQVLALSVVLLSSFFLIKGTLALSKKDLAELSTSKWGYNLDVARNLCHQRSDTIVGFALLLLSFFLQLTNLLWEIRIKDFAVNKAGVVIALITSVLIFFIAYSISDFLYKTSYRQVEEILTKTKK